MNYRDLQIVKKDFDGLCAVFDKLEEIGALDRFSEDISCRDVLRFDVARFLMYLSAADGRIDENEVTVYQVVTGYGDNASEIIDTIKNQQIYSTTFESTVPISLKKAIEAQYKLLRVMEQTQEVTLPELFVDMFERIGTLLIEADGGITYTERRDFNIYMDTLRGYLRERGF